VRTLGTLLTVLGTLASAPLRAQDPPRSSTAVVSGTVRNSVTNAPMRIVAVRAAASGASTLTDDGGRFRLELSLGEQRLEVRRIGFRPATVNVVVQPEGTLIDIKLEPIAVALDRVLITAQDDAARRIITNAIRRKQESRGSFHDYRFDGEVRMIVRNLNKPADSTTSILGITETRTTAYWEQPNKYQETIVARRQTGNIDAERNLVGVGRILDFSSDRVQLGRFELTSPIADDALDRYDFRLLDTIAAAGRRVFRLSLEPKPDGTPAFAGIIDVADSTFDVTGIDVGVNDAVRLGLMRNVRYQQRFDTSGGRWMPRSIELTAEMQIPIGSQRFRMQHIAVLSGYRFDEGRRPAGLAEYRIKVADSADRADSSTWTRSSSPTLTALERQAWTRIDSVAEAVTPAQRAFSGVLGFVGQPDFFHFNRVDGAYVGAGWTWRNPAAMPGTEPTAKLGYATASQLWQYRLGGRVRLSESRRLWVGATYQDETIARPTFTSSAYNPTLRALFSAIDPLDYHRERGLRASLTTKVVNFVQLDAAYVDARHLSLPLGVTRPPLRRSGAAPMRPNEPIDEGYLRALSATVFYDSRPLLQQGGRDLRLGRVRWTRVAIEGELSPGDAIGSDFDYRRLSVRLDRRQLTLGMGVTTMVAAGGIGSSGLPAQRFFGIDGGGRVLETQISPFGTLMDSSFKAPRAALFALQHDFDRLLFTKTGIPLVRDIPFTLSIRGAVFWTDFVGSSAGAVARVPYREVGFSLGNLTPFIAPFNFSARFAWQLSKYPTTPFRFGIGLAP
jgi:hypothetical protein